MIGRRGAAWAPWLVSGTAVGLLCCAIVLHLATRDEAGATAADTLLFVVSCTCNVSAPLVGGLIARRLPASPYGWLLLAIGMGISLLAVLPTLRQAEILTYWIGAWLEGAVFLTLPSLMILVMLLFPDGRLPSRRWRWLPRMSVVLALLLAVALPFTRWEDDPAAASPWGLPATAANPPTSTPWALRGAVGMRLSELFDLGVFVLVVLATVAVGSILVRFRRAGPVVRQQLKWFLFAGALLVATVVPEATDVRIGDSVWPSVEAAAFGLMPIAVGIAILRYRLFEIDRVISRTVTYALLTAGLVGMYFVVVTLLRWAAAPVIGSSAPAVVLSTLAVAAAFRPVHRRVQAAVDRRFDRARYDAARAVDAFAVRLRDQIDLDELVTGLGQTVAATVAPTRIGVWLRRSPSGGG
ncbi:hypothetical protein [Blastococcus saxobsidens]|uniref:hypothetical protein n=1 Tax=Blastococcus saxobsidens TaxID=138336 RepID=UPI00102C2D29|nr:hypothetical protein [Blastococcus saxobsidens]